MSEENTQGVFRGPDGNLSGRRIIGTAFLGLGAVLLVVAQFQEGDLTKFLASGIALVVGALFWGLVTVQNITDALKK